MNNANNNKDTLNGILLRTGREGIGPVLEKLEQLGFYEAPASSAFHLNVPGGLVTHSLNVYNTAMCLKQVVLSARPELADRLTDESIAIAALLHDVCKADIYRVSIKHRKNADGRWEDYQGYEVDYHGFPMGHGEKSVIFLLREGLKLTDDEMLAIRWHMSAWDLAFQSSEEKSSLNAAREICPLLSVLQAADGLSAGIFENDFKS